jgi:hypothetical protein
MSEGGLNGRAARLLGADDWLSFAATPVFAIMALLVATVDIGPAFIICSATHGASPIGGMMPMYVLMSAFHSAPWIRLIRARFSHCNSLTNGCPL